MSSDVASRVRRFGVLGAIVLAGVLSLPRALGGDQALFLYMAKSIHHGSVLYRDVWDAKQPGIYIFYWTAGNLFGFNEIAVHLLELLVMLTLAVVLQRTLPDFGFSRRAAALAPLATVLPYYIVSATWDLGQLEPLIGLPLYLGFWTSLRARKSAEHRERWLFAAGACCAVVTIFKLLYLPYGVLFLAFSLRREQRVRNAAIWGLGFAAAWSPVLIWVLAHGLVHEVWYTWISFPGTSRRQAAQPLSVLTSSARSFGRSFAPVAALAVVGLWASWRRRVRWMVLAFAWAVLAMLLDLMQFWWRYLYWDASVPVGLVAVLGVIALHDNLREHRRAVLGSLAAVLLLTAYALTPQRERIAESFPDPTATFRDTATRDDLRALEEPLYGDLDTTLAVLRAPDARPGAVVIFGSPIIQLASGREQAGKLPGFLANTLGPDEWHDFATQMRTAPPAYVFIGEVQGVSEDEFLQTRGAEVRDILDQSYCEVAHISTGRWLVQCHDVADAPGALRRAGTTP
jgi:hypothetical protein